MIFCCKWVFSQLEVWQRLSWRVTWSYQLQGQEGVDNATVLKHWSLHAGFWLSKQSTYVGIFFLVNHLLTPQIYLVRIYFSSLNLVQSPETCPVHLVTNWRVRNKVCVCACVCLSSTNKILSPLSPPACVCEPAHAWNCVTIQRCCHGYRLTLPFIFLPFFLSLQKRLPWRRGPTSITAARPTWRSSPAGGIRSTTWLTTSRSPTSSPTPKSVYIQHTHRHTHTLLL